MRPRLLVLLVLLASGLSAGSARAATSIGDVTTAPTTAIGGGEIFLQSDGGTGRPYTVPVGGVVTSLRAQARLTSGAMTGTLRLLVLHPGGGTVYTVLGGGDVSFENSVFTTSSAQTSIPVQAGDLLGVYSPPLGALVGIFPTSGATLLAKAMSTAPADGAPVDLSGAASVGDDISLAATVEPDADHDGFGDESQDSCPQDASVHTGGCTADLQVFASAAPAIVTQGDVSTIVATVSNATASNASGVSAALTIPAGLSVVAASTTGGECAGTTCTVGDFPAGQTRKVYLVVRGTAAGTRTVSVHVAGSGPDPNLANNGATASLLVTPAPAPRPPAKVVKLCTVPSLKGKTAAATRAALKKAGCRAGTAKGSKSKKARVSTQTIPAKVKVLAGTKVGFTLKSKAVKKKKKKKKK